MVIWVYACYRLFQEVKQGVEELFTCESIIAEVVYVLSSSRAPYQLSHSEVRDRLLPILSLRELKIPQKRTYLRALDLVFFHNPAPHIFAV